MINQNAQSYFHDSEPARARRSSVTIKSKFFGKYAIITSVILVCANTGLIPWDRPEHLYNVDLWIVIAIILTYSYGRKTLTREQNK